MKINSLKDWKACLQQVAVKKESGSFLAKINGKTIDAVHLKKGAHLDGFIPLTLEKIVGITKQLSSSAKDHKDAALGLAIGRLAFLQETESKGMSSDEPSLLMILCAIWNRCCNLIIHGEFKTGSEIAQDYARHLLTFDQFPSFIKSNIEECIKDPNARVIPWKAETDTHKQLMQAVQTKAHTKKEAFIKFLGVWLLTGYALNESIALANSNISDFVGIKALKQKQQSHLAKLTAFAKKNEWKHLQTHTAHPDSGFDWWMFPINRSSNGYGTQYQLSSSDINALKKDAQFMKNYRKGVILVTKSWGWDLEKDKNISDSKKYWTNYQVRLGKMAHSLVLFDQKDLLKSLSHFIKSKKIDLEPWIKRCLTRSFPHSEISFF